MSELVDRWQQVVQRIAHATRSAGREAGSVRLLAVSKTKPAAMVEQLHAAGQQDFGESYLQEALAKIEALQGAGIGWHFIGPLQSNKTRQVAEHFDWVHSVDRVKIAQRLNDQRPADKPPLKVLIQVNVSAEASKSGVTEKDELLTLAKTVADAPHLELMGLMAIPMADASDEQQHAAFRQLRELRDYLADKLGQPLPELSMGMSDDLEPAVAEGSTWVRIGTAIFGERDYS